MSCYRFVSKDPHLMISNVAIKEAAENPHFVVTFHPKDGMGLFETPNPAVAAAITGLIENGRLADVKAIPAPSGAGAITLDAVVASAKDMSKEGKEPVGLQALAEALGATEDALKKALVKLTKGAPEAEATLEAAGVPATLYKASK